MSTKIFNGYKIEKEMSVFELTELLNNMSKDFQEICKDLYHKEVARLASKYLDYKIVFGEDEANEYIKSEYDYTPKTNNDNLFLCVHNLVNRDCNSKERIHSDFDFKCEFKLLPIKNKTLFLLYTTKKEYKELLDNCDENGLEIPSIRYPLISSYIYYNNTDKPGIISEKNWDIRREDWDNALKNNEKGLIYSLTEAPYAYNTDILSEKIKNMYDKRINCLAKHKLEKDFFKENKHLTSKDDILAYFKVYSKYVKTDKYKIELDNLIKEFKLKVAKTYNKEDFKDIKLY